MQLGISAILLALLIGISLGSLAALRQNSAVDFAVLSVSMVGIAVPNFVMAPLLSLVIGVYLDLLPTSVWGGGAWRYKVLPVIALARPQIPSQARLPRGSLFAELPSNFLSTAR